MSTNKSIFSKIISAANEHAEVTTAVELLAKTVKSIVSDVSNISTTIGKIAVVVNQHKKAIDEILEIQEMIVNHLKISSSESLMHKTPVRKKEDLN